MTQQGNQDPNIYADLPFSNTQKRTGPVFPGKAYLPNPHAGGGNLAVQRSLMQIFDEFTQIISGELKSMNMQEFEQENPDGK
jgi:hypothetical protein